MAALYEISAQYASILDAVERAESEDEAYELLDELAEIGDALENKAEQFIRIIKVKEAEAEAFKAEADRLSRKKKAAENVAERLKKAMLDAMQLTGQKEIKTSIGKWRVQNNPWSCEVVNIDKVPMAYHIKQEDKIDKAGLLKHFALTGEVVDGCEFVQKPGIRFR